MIQTKPMNQTKDVQQRWCAANALPTSLLAAGSALLILLAVAACGQQDDTVDGQGEVPTGQEDTQTQQSPGAGEQKRMGGGGMQKAPATKPSDSTADAPPSPQFRSLDSNGDGLISASEAKKKPGLGSSFNELDMNGDGQLSTQEFAAFASGGAGGKPVGGKASPGKLDGGQGGGTPENPNRPAD